MEKMASDTARLASSRNGVKSPIGVFMEWGKVTREWGGREYFMLGEGERGGRFGEGEGRERVVGVKGRSRSGILKFENIIHMC